MIPQRKATRALRSAGALVVAALALAGCAPEPSPTPSPTAAFASEEEAFAAAEEVYRAYIEASNNEQSDASANESNKYLTGDLLESEIEAARDLEARGIHIEGPTVILSFKGISADFASAVPTIRAHACLDISDARAIAADGTDVTSPGRSDIYGVNVTMSGTASSMLVSAFEVSPDSQC